ncbi:MAG: CoA-binding protein [Candidatus Bathyarchaeota archaeon]|nr:CoA-binding protein [Candidatus Bathyarchaeota archaeon]
MIADNDLKELLIKSKTIAIVGCSRDPKKAAHSVPKYLNEQGYEIIPVNPFADEILGIKVRKSLSEIEKPIDIVNIFRPSDECLQVVKESIELRPRAIWMQLGIENEEAAKLAENHGICVVENKCIYIEHKRLINNNKY